MEYTLITYRDSDTVNAEQQHNFTSLNEAHDFVRLVSPSFFLTELIYILDGEEIIETWTNGSLV